MKRDSFLPYFAVAFIGVSLASGFSTLQASFHFMQIEQVVGGANGQTADQAVQLRMRSNFQNFVAGARIVAWDQTGANPVTIMDFPTAVANSSAGSHVLIATASMVAATNPPLVADFTMTNAIPAAYLAAGSLTFEAKVGSTVFWRLCWGNYTGPTNGSLANDADGQFGPPFSGPLPTAADQGLLFTGPASALSTSNLFDYQITAAAAVLTNNSGASFTVQTITDAPRNAQFKVLTNRPNPFNPSTELEFSLRQDSKAQLRVYNARGHLVTTLFQGTAVAGTHRVQWNGENSVGLPVASGIYHARLQTPDGTQYRKLILLK